MAGSTARSHGIRGNLMNPLGSEVYNIFGDQQFALGRYRLCTLFAVFALD